MTIKHIIGINGKINSGKDTAAVYLSDLLCGNIQHFAEPVKDIASQIFNVPRDWFDNRILKEKDFKTKSGRTLNVRELMVFVAQSFKEKDPDVWVNLCNNKINQIYINNRDAFRRKVMFFIIPDLRFENEAKICDTTIKIVRDKADTGNTSVSENSLNDYKFTYTIDNNGSLEEFYLKLHKIAMELELEALNKVENS